MPTYASYGIMPAGVVSLAVLFVHEAFQCVD